MKKNLLIFSTVIQPILSAVVRIKRWPVHAGTTQINALPKAVGVQFLTGILVGILLLVLQSVETVLTPLAPTEMTGDALVLDRDG